MDFRKMRASVKSDGTMGRSWEKGFVSTECGENAADDIKYLQIYKPDIHGNQIKYI